MVIETRLHSLTMAEIAICLLVDTTRCLADHALVCSKRQQMPLSQGPKVHRPTEARSECQLRDSADLS